MEYADLEKGLQRRAIRLGRFTALIFYHGEAMDRSFILYDLA